MTSIHDYWYYNNDMYEAKSTINPQGVVTDLVRHITGPMDRDELVSLMKSPNIIPANQQIQANGVNTLVPALGWQNAIVARLQVERFNTVNILDGVPRGVGITTKGYLKSFFTWKTAGKTALTAGGIAFICFSPVLLAKLAPEFATQLGLGTIEKEGVVTFLKASWYKILVPTSANIALSAVHGLVVTAVAFKILSKLNAEIGPKQFKAWQASKMDIFIHNKQDLVPQDLEQDSIFQQNICPITTLPIRSPVKIAANGAHIFEEGALLSWIMQQMANNLQPTCPLTRVPIVLPFHRETALSDMIELRILLLQSQ